MRQIIKWNCLHPLTWRSDLVRQHLLAAEIHVWLLKWKEKKRDCGKYRNVPPAFKCRPIYTLWHLFQLLSEKWKRCSLHCGDDRTRRDVNFHAEGVNRIQIVNKIHFSLLLLLSLIKSRSWVKSNAKVGQVKISCVMHFPNVIFKNRIHIFLTFFHSISLSIPMRNAYRVRYESQESIESNLWYQGLCLMFQLRWISSFSYVKSAIPPLPFTLNYAFTVIETKKKYYEKNFCLKWYFVISVQLFHFSWLKFKIHCHLVPHCVISWW